MKRENDEERRKPEVQGKMMDGQIRRKEMGTRRIQMQLNRDEEKKKDEELRHSLENKDITRNEEEKKTKEEELIERQEEDMRRYEKDEEYRDTKEKIRSEQEMEGNIEYEADNRLKEQTQKQKDKERMQEEVKKRQEKDDMGIKEGEARNKQTDNRHNLDMVKENIKMEERILKEEGESLNSQNENTGSTEDSMTSQLGGNTTLTSSSSAPLPSEFTARPTSSVAANQHDPQRNISQISLHKTIASTRSSRQSWDFFLPLPTCLPEHTEQKMLLWMKNCISWSKLSLQNRRKEKGSTWSRRGLRRAAEASSLPPLCPHTLLQSTGWKSLHEVTMMTLEDLPGCNLSTLVQCTQLRSLTLRRCGLKSWKASVSYKSSAYIDLQVNRESKLNLF
ncbi:LOW QUALITY PROTEIN: leucine-rich repeat and IQ domain-containing protein 1-like [Acanthochromis polyacanthus]|uniref:LOW QUALITY PROTEIN: leucine-rich repeat and IQ domain-containing protein 1-like n=1 Tax=Acanthochromis polyacanthus TaxID=80966 RepID=UPI002233F4C7|nr:LOW QUALITY PROTEIN: leucine-rich repeat and IQ domain-containing protein 1-like [Acanthochromis polyacanthus]